MSTITKKTKVKNKKLVSNTTQSDHKLTLKDVMDMLLKDGLVGKSEYDSVIFPARSASTLDIHPIVLISQQEWRNSQNKNQILDATVLSEWLAQRVELPFYFIDPLKIDVSSVTQVISQAYATRYKILPIQVDTDKVIVAVSEPYITSWQSELRHVTGGLEIECVFSNPVDVSRYIEEFYRLSDSIRIATGNKEDEIPGISNLEQLVELGKTGQLDANDQHVVHVVDWLLQYAFEQRASDIHMEPRRESANIRFRIDGVLHLVYEMPMPVMNAVASRIKVLGRMDIVEKRRPQDGRIKMKLPDGKEVELRLSTMPTAFGEKFVMRIFNPDVLTKDFTAMGFGEKDIAIWNEMVTQAHGIILVTGPTGSGKTTTLYSTLRQLSSPDINVCTVEDPIENVVDEFNQMQIQQNIGLDFASGIRTLLRQDPDIIMVGEIRDKETAEMAIQSALTGHLVLSTLHTNDSAAAIPRLREIGIPAYLINATLIGVMAQRLIRTLCPNCKQPTEIDKDLWKQLTKPYSMSGKAHFYKPVGCKECRQTGFLGRIGIYEMLKMSHDLRQKITPNSDANEIRRLSIKEGNSQLRIDGARKVAMGITTIDEVLKVVSLGDD
ncbi:Type II secretory pathway, ATPase PulE/Tfp pilus assembly pathway, ATPase PilB [hydrothermal vent metagenome]|uniref:Type II secretory pathway, ATPase PulE/Tfp pilus assembly pathway, ATPase PilB n=1 Tax=hydrothermal vent metagenome TaxID=652676 RepID=A0A3B1ABP8_9ZZZZ